MGHLHVIGRRSPNDRTNTDWQKPETILPVKFINNCYNSSVHGSRLESIGFVTFNFTRRSMDFVNYPV